jgi:hypothetical protein
MAYDHKTEVRIHAGDLRVLASRIETALGMKRYRKPKTGTWEQLDKKLNAVCNAACEVLEDIKGHINPEEGEK